MNYLRKRKSAKFNQIKKNTIPKKTLSTIQCKSATILPLQKSIDDSLIHGRGGVIDSNSTYIPLSGIPGKVWGKYDTKPLYRSGKALYLGYAVDHWGHFLIEGITRLWYMINNSDSSIDYYVFIVEKDSSRIPSENYQSFFKLLGIEMNLEFLDKPTQFDEVIIPEVSFNFMTHYSDEYISLFTNTISSAFKTAKIGNTYDKILLTRTNFGPAIEKEYGFKAIESFFERNGFTVISPELIPLDDFIVLLNSCKTLVTPSGSAAHNILFLKQKIAVVELERQAIFNRVDPVIETITGHNVTHIDANYSFSPVSTSYGPFFYALNKHLMQYALDNNMSICKPNEYDKYIKNQLLIFFESFFSRYKLGMECKEWIIDYTQIVYEAFVDTNAEIEYIINTITLDSFISSYTKRQIEE